MDWQQLVALTIVAITAAVLLWSRFRPRILLVEAHERTVSAIENDPINVFAVAAGYRLIAKTLNTLIYEDEAGESSSGAS